MVTGDQTTSALLLERYRVEAQQDEGDFGTTMRAYDTQRGRQVEISAPRRDATTGDLIHARERFANAAEAGVRIGAREEIVAVLDLASDADGTPYLICEYAAGGTLAERLAYGTPLPLPEAVTITRDVARALMAAHDVGVVHRDVRPANIHLTADERAKLGGFIFAQIENSARPASLEAMIPMPPDAARYAPPEQEGATETAQPSSDQYRLGLVFFEMLIGVAFTTLEPDDAWARAAWQSPAVFAALKRMTMENPTERYPSMAAVIEALDRITLTRANDAPSPAMAVPPLSLPADPAPVDVAPLPAFPAISPRPDAATRETAAVPRMTAPLPVVSVAAVGPPAALPLRRAPRARMSGLILILLVGALLLARGAGVGSRQSIAATATVMSAAGIETATPAPTPSVVPPTATPIPPTPTALVGAATASVPRAALVPATVGSGTSTTPLPVSSAPSALPVPSATNAMNAVMPTVTRTAPGGTASATVVPASVATRVPDATVAAMPVTTPTATLVPATLVPLPLSATPVPASSSSTSPTQMPLPSALAVQSVGTTNQALTTITPQDSVVQFVAGQEVFGWVNFGGATIGQDTLDVAVLANGATVTTQQVTLAQPEGFAVFSLGALPAGPYTLQVAYRGNVVRESTFTVTAVGAAPAQLRVVPTAVPRVAPAAPAALADPAVPPDAAPPVAPATAAPVIAVPPVMMAPLPTAPPAPPAVVAPPAAAPTAVPPMIAVVPPVVAAAPMVMPTPPPRDN